VPDPTPRTPLLRLAVVLGLLTFSGVTLATNIVPTRDGLRATRRQLEEQERENRLTLERIDVLRDDADALTNDVWDIQRVLREEFRLTDEGEVQVR